MAKYFSILVILSLTGCMAAVFGTADQLNQLSIGMTKEDVLNKLVQPKTISAKEGIEYLQYKWVKSVIAADGNFPEDYYVAINNGRVISFGRKGDFDSAQAPAQRIKVEQTIHQDESKDIYIELKKLSDLKESGIITNEEFNVQKNKLLVQ